MSRQGLLISEKEEGIIRSGKKRFSYWYVNEGGRCVTITRHSGKGVSTFFIISGRLTAEEIADGDDCFLGNNFTDSFRDALGIAKELLVERAA